MFTLHCPSEWICVSIVMNPDAPSKRWLLVLRDFIQCANIKVLITRSITVSVQKFGGCRYDDGMLHICAWHIQERIFLNYFCRANFFDIILTVISKGYNFVHKYICDFQYPLNYIMSLF